MATTIKLKNSVTTTNAPSSLVQGEVAINITDKKVWVGNAATTPIQLLGAGSSASFGALTCTSLTNSGLTSGRVTYASTSGLLADSANFTFNGTTVTMANDASISGLTVGKGTNSQTYNTALGVDTLKSASLTGNYNTGIGREALYSNTTGSVNTAVGNGALYANTTGQENIAVGSNTLDSNTTGSYNTAVGRDALQANTTASYSTAVGYRAGYLNTGALNTYVGAQTGENTSTGTENTGHGAAGLYSNTTGSYNTALGRSALFSNTTASNNTAVGYQAGYSLTTGGSNTVMGYQAFDAATTASSSTIVGNRAGGAITTGVNNTIIGADAGASLTTGNGNCFIGATGTYASGEVITTGSKNTIIGSYNGNLGGLDIRTGNNYIVLSDGDGNVRQYFNGTVFVIPEGSNTINYSITTNGTSRYVVHNKASGDGSGFTYNIFQNVGTNVGTISYNGSGVNYNTTSDYRLKENIAPMTGALATVAKLKPCTYTWKESGEASQGFIAHELAEVVPECVTGEKDAVDADGKILPQGVDTSYLVATLTAAIQELKAEVDSLKAQLNK